MPKTIKKETEKNARGKIQTFLPARGPRWNRPIGKLNP